MNSPFDQPTFETPEGSPFAPSANPAAQIPGIQGMSDPGMGLGMPSYYERTPLKDVYLQGHFVENSRQAQTRERDYMLAAQGIHPEEYDAMMETQAMLAQALSQGPQRQIAQLQQPNKIQSGLGILSAVLDPRHAAQNVAGVMNAQVGAQQLQQRQYDLQYEQDEDNYTRRIQGLSQLAKMAQDRYQEAVRRSDKAEQDKIRNDARLIDDINQAGQAYDRAKSPTAKERAARHYNSLLTPEKAHLALSEEEIASDVEKLNLANVDDIDKMVTARIAQYMRTGQITEKQADELQKWRDTVARKMEIDPALLGPIPLGSTMQKQAFDFNKQKWDQQFGLMTQKFSFDKEKFAKSLAEKAKDREVAWARVAVYKMAAQNGAILGYGNLQMRVYEAEADAQKASGAYIQDANEKIMKLRAELSGVTNSLPGAKGNKKAELELKKKELEGTIGALEASKQGPELQTPFGNYPNPYYQPQQQVPPPPQLQQPNLNPNAPVNPFQGQISPIPGKTLTNAKPAPKPKPRTKKKANFSLPSGWGVSG